MRLVSADCIVLSLTFAQRFQQVVTWSNKRIIGKLYVVRELVADTRLFYMTSVCYATIILEVRGTQGHAGFTAHRNCPVSE